MLRPVPKERHDDDDRVVHIGAHAHRPSEHEPPVEGLRPTLRPVLSPSSVGATLSITREKFGQDLKQVAQALRIRQSYLEAIEEDRYADLPGLTYAVGFVRSYADYLGLDSKLLVERYKEEAQGLNRRTQLVFPTPAAEAKVPTGAIILMALILIGLTYLGWTYFSDDAKAPAVAERANQPATAPAASPPAPAPAPLASGSTTDSTTQPPAAAAPAAPEPAPAPASTTAAPAPDATAAIASEAAAPPSASPAPQAASESAASTGVPPAPPAPASPAVTDGAVVTGSAVVGEQQAGLVPPPLPEAVEAAHRPRLLIRAEQDSWVQIRNAKDEAILTKVMREGESYEVPEEPGLVLLTGNAGGIVIELDGQPLPPLGPVGAVRRNIMLDPDTLGSQ